VQTNGKTVCGRNPQGGFYHRPPGIGGPLAISTLIATRPELSRKNRLFVRVKLLACQPYLSSKSLAAFSMSASAFSSSSLHIILIDLLYGYSRHYRIHIYALLFAAFGSFYKIPPKRGIMAMANHHSRLRGYITLWRVLTHD
jgi:hypothetical protein